MNPTPPSGVRPRLVVLKGVTRPALLPYVVLVLLLLTVGSIVLLLLNTALNGGDFTRQRLEQQQTKLEQRTDELRQRLQRESAPNSLASRAAQLGMVPVPNPAFLDPANGQVFGDAQRATAPPVSGVAGPSASATPDTPAGPTTSPAAALVGAKPATHADDAAGMTAAFVTLAATDRMPVAPTAARKGPR